MHKAWGGGFQTLRGTPAAHASIFHTQNEPELKSIAPGGGDPGDIHHHCLDYCFVYVASGWLPGSHRTHIGASSSQQPLSTVPSL